MVLTTKLSRILLIFFFFQAEDGIRDKLVTGVQTCALPISRRDPVQPPARRAAGRARDHAAIAHEVAIVSDGKDVAHEALGGAHAGARVEDEVAVPIFRVHGYGVPAAARADLAEGAASQLAGTGIG